jgi:hypothetical protein
MSIVDCCRVDTIKKKSEKFIFYILSICCCSIYERIVLDSSLTIFMYSSANDLDEDDDVKIVNYEINFSHSYFCFIQLFFFFFLLYRSWNIRIRSGLLPVTSPFPINNVKCVKSKQIKFDLPCFVLFDKLLVNL